MLRLPRALALAVVLVGCALALGASLFAAAQDTTPDADNGTEVVSYVDEDGEELARLTVLEVVDPVDDRPCRTEEGERNVFVTVRIENAGEDPLPLDRSDILVRDTDGFLYGPDDDLQRALGEGAAATPGATPMALPEQAAIAEGELAPGLVEEGALGFAVRSEADLSEVLFVPEAGRLLILAELGVDRDGEPRATTAATSTPRAVATEEATTSPRATATPRPTATPTAPPEPTVPPDIDSDGDGLIDADEAAIGTDPATADTDGDGLGDGDEANVGTDPFTPDTDGDAVLDGDEVLAAGTDPFVLDTDGDGLGDADELGLGTDPFVPDTDGDGILDGAEVEQGTDPFDPGSTVAVNEPAGTAPAATTEPAGDGTDADADGLAGEQEQGLGTDPAAPDTDDDGLPDGDEVNLHGTSPLAADTDGDGRGDIDEVVSGTDPTDPASP